MHLTCIWSLFRNGFLTITVLALSLTAGGTSSRAAEPWDFVRLHVDGNSKWDVRKGKAEIEVDGQDIEIRASFDGDALAGETDPRAITRLLIKGKIGPEGTIVATSTLLNTDANPTRITGKYTKRTKIYEIAGIKKTVEFSQIIFSLPPNWEFMGFAKRTVLDK
jgi:hypothetical protein